MSEFSITTKLKLDVSGFSKLTSINKNLETLSEKLKKVDDLVDKVNSSISRLGDVSVSMLKIEGAVITPLNEVKRKVDASVAEINRSLNNLKFNNSSITTAFETINMAMSTFTSGIKVSFAELQGAINVRVFKNRLGNVAKEFDNAFGGIQEKIQWYLAGINTEFGDVFFGIAKSVKAQGAIIVKDIAEMVANVKQQFDKLNEAVDQARPKTEKKASARKDSSTSKVAGDKPIIDADAPIKVVRANTKKITDELDKSAEEIKKTKEKNNKKIAEVEVQTTKVSAKAQAIYARGLETRTGVAPEEKSPKPVKAPKIDDSNTGGYLKSMENSITTANAVFESFVSKIDGRVEKVESALDKMFKPFDKIEDRMGHALEVSQKMAEGFGLIKKVLDEFTASFAVNATLLEDGIKGIMGVGTGIKSVSTGVKGAYKAAADQTKDYIKTIKSDLVAMNRIAVSLGKSTPKVANAAKNLTAGIKGIEISKDFGAKVGNFVAEIDKMTLAASSLASASATLRGMKDFSFAGALTGKMSSLGGKTNELLTVAGNITNRAAEISDKLAVIEKNVLGTATSLLDSAAKIVGSFEQIERVSEGFTASLSKVDEPLKTVGSAVNAAAIDFKQAVDLLSTGFKEINGHITRAKELATSTKDVYGTGAKVVTNASNGISKNAKFQDVNQLTGIATGLGDANAKIAAELLNIDKSIDAIVVKFASVDEKVAPHMQKVLESIVLLKTELLAVDEPLKGMGAAVKNSAIEFSAAVKILGNAFDEINSHIASSKQLAGKATDIYGRNATAVNNASDGIVKKDAFAGLAKSSERLANAIDKLDGKGESLSRILGSIRVPKNQLRNLQEVMATLERMGKAITEVKGIADGAQAAFRGFGFGSATAKNIGDVSAAVKNYITAAGKIAPFSQKIVNAFYQIGQVLEANSLRVTRAADLLIIAMSRISTRLATLSVQLKRNDEYWTKFRTNINGSKTEIATLNDPVKRLRMEFTDLKNEARDALGSINHINIPPNLRQKGRPSGSNGNNNSNASFFGASGGSVSKLAGGFGRVSRSIITANQGLQLMRTLMAELNIYPMQIAKGFVDAARKVEDLSTRMLTLTGSVKITDQIMADMSDFATKVPFEFQGVLEASTRLVGILNTDKPIEETKKWMGMIADLAAVSGLSIEEATSQTIRMYSAGAQAADMFRERGISAMMGFKANVKYTAADTRRMIEESYNSSSSKFRGATQLLAQNMTGILSMIADKYFLFQNRIMSNGPFTAFKTIVAGFDNLLTENQSSVNNWAREVGESIGRFIFDARDFAYGAYNTLDKSFSNIKTSTDAIVQLLRDFHVLETVNWGLIATGIAAMWAAFPTLGTLVAIGVALDKIGAALKEIQAAGGFDKWANSEAGATKAKQWRTSRFGDDGAQSIDEDTRKVELAINNLQLMLDGARDVLSSAVESFADSWVSYWDSAAFGETVKDTFDGVVQEIKDAEEKIPNKIRQVVDRTKIAFSVDPEVLKLQKEQFKDTIKDFFDQAALQATISGGNLEAAIRAGVGQSLSGFSSFSIQPIGTGAGKDATSDSDAFYRDLMKKQQEYLTNTPLDTPEQREISGKQLELKNALKVGQDLQIRLLNARNNNDKDLMVAIDSDIRSNAIRVASLQDVLRRLQRTPATLDTEPAKEDKKRETKIQSLLKKLESMKDATLVENAKINATEYEKKMAATIERASQLNEELLELGNISPAISAKAKELIAEITKLSQKNVDDERLKAFNDQMRDLGYELEKAGLSAQEAGRTFDIELRQKLESLSLQAGFTTQQLMQLESVIRAIRDKQIKLEISEKTKDVSREISKIGKSAQEIAQMEFQWNIEDIPKEYFEKNGAAASEMVAQMWKLQQLQQNITFADGTRHALDEVQANFQTFGEATTEFLSTTFSALGDTLGTVFFDVFTGGLDDAGKAFEEFGKTILKTVMQIMANRIAAQLITGAFGMMGMGGGVDFSKMLGTVMHGGGIVGSSLNGRKRSVPASLFYGAPRFHNGLLNSNEFPAILERGEQVIPNGMKIGGGVQNVTVSIKNESGESLKVTKSEAKTDHTQTVIDIVVDGIARNRSGLRDMMMQK